MTPMESPAPTIEQLAEEFLQRYRQGERPAVAEYTARHPELADDIRDVFAALMLVEEAGPQDIGKPSAFRGRVTADGKVPQQLGDYRIVREVGRGGMGVVYEAVQESLGRHVALKVLPYEASANPTYLERFTREARAAARLHHTNIVPVHDVGEHQGVHYYAMQFIQGQGLDEVLLELRRLRANKTARTVVASSAPDLDDSANAENKLADKRLASSIAQGVVSGRFSVPESEKTSQENGNGILAESGRSSPSKARSGLSTSADFQYYRSVARLGLQVAEALGYAHAQKVLHRDIKPSNLLLDFRGTVWVTDFGLAKEGGDDLTKTGDVVGTLRYLAPERFNGVSEARSDIYSLGLTLYEMLTLRPAFDEQDRGRLIRCISHYEPAPPRRFDRRIPRDLETIILKAIAKEPKKRYATAEELIEDLRRFLADRPILARRTSWQEHAWRWVRRNPGWAATLATVFGLLLLMAVGGLVLNLHLQKALTNARNAEQAKTDKVWESLLERAAAKRTSGRVGQRFESLEAIREAAQIRISPEMRHEAAAALILPDVKWADEWEAVMDDSGVIAFDADYQRCATMDRRGQLTISHRTDQGAEVVATIPAYGRPSFYRLWMSPDGQYVAYGHTARLSTALGLRVWRLTPNPSVALDDPAGVHESSLTFRADGQQVAVGHTDGFVSVWDLKSGLRRQHLKLAAAPHSLAFHPRDARLAAVCGNDVYIFDVDTGRELTVLHHDPEARSISGVAWHPDGRRLATGCYDRRIHMWDTETAREIMRPWEGHAQLGIAMFFNHRGDRLASHDWGDHVRLWDTSTGTLLLTIPGPLAIHFSQDDRFIGFQQVGNKIRLMGLASGSELQVLRRRQALPGEIIYAPVVNADGRLVAAPSYLPAASTKNWFNFFDPESGEELASINLPNSGDFLPVENRAYAQSDGWLTAGSVGILAWPCRYEEGEVKSNKLKVKSNKLESHSNHSPTLAHDTSLFIGPPRVVGPAPSRAGIAASENGKRVVWPHPKGAIVLDRNSPERQIPLQPHYDVRNCAISPDGRWVITASHWGDEEARWTNARVWDAETGRHITDLPLGGSTIPAFSPNGRWLATFSRGDGFRLWETGSWQERLRLPEAAFAFSADSRMLAVSDILGVIRLLETETGREIARLTGPEATGYEPACFTPDGTRLIATCSTHKALYAWDLRQLRARLKELDLDWDWPEFPEESGERRVQSQEQVRSQGSQIRSQGSGTRSQQAATSALPPLTPDPRPLTPGLKVTADAGFIRQRPFPDARQAIRSYTLALALLPLYPEAYLQRAWANRRLEDYDGALRDLENLLTLNPELVDCRGLFALLANNVSWHYVTTARGEGRGARLLPLAQKAVQLEPNNDMYRNTLGVVLYRLGKYQEAIDCLQQNVKSDGDSYAFDGFFLAMAYHHLGNGAKARDWFEKSNAWFQRRKDLSAVWSQELTGFRAEAAELLGVKEFASTPAR
jgi:serine/threonine protein kinase/WD40 repeat protein